jgi:sugar phosphate isomerase/epimerase
MKNIMMGLFLATSFFSGRAQNSPQKNWKLAVQLWTFNKFTFTEAINKADSCGFKYIEAYPGQKLGGNFTGEMGPSMSSAERKKLKEFLRSKGITFLAFGVVDGADDAKKDKDWKDVFDFAKEMGIVEITAMPTAGQLDMVNELAGKYHIRVAIHDEPGKNPYDHPDSVLRAIENRPNLGACVDIGNWIRNGVDIVDCLKRQLHGRVFSVHLKDVETAGVARSPEVALGNGVCNVPEILKELKTEGFTGFFSIEEPSRGVDINKIKKDIEYFHAQVQTLK